MNNIKPRDFIASQAMRVLLEKFDPEKYNINHIAKDAYAIADAMVVESSK
jgi:hypothetical protein